MGVKRWLVAASCVLSLVAAVSAEIVGPPPQQHPAAGSSRVVELRINGEIEPVMAEYIDDGIDKANREGAALILITMDTPGGLDTSMRAIIQHIVESNSPVAVYVAPTGSTRRRPPVSSCCSPPISLRWRRRHIQARPRRLQRLVDIQ